MQELQDCSAYFRLTAANGLGIPMAGLLIVSIELCEQTYHDVHVVVVKEDSLNVDMRARKEEVPGIIGCNMLDLLHKSIQASVPLSSVFQNAVQLYSNEHAVLQKDVLSFVKTANSTLSLSGTARHWPGNFDVLVEPIEGQCYPDLIVMPTFTTLQEGRVLFEVANTGSQDIWFKHPTTIAKISIVTEMMPEFD